MGLLWTVFVIWGLVVSCVVPFAFKEGFVAGMTFLAVAWGPTALLVWYVVNRAGNREKAHAQMLAAAGVSGGSGSDHAEDGTGIAINRAAKTLTLLVAGFHKTYPFDAIREWETRKERAGQVVAVGVAGIAAAGANARAARDASANTGLFVTVKDVDNPKWRIAMKDEAIQARWMEILRQELNER
jgi:Domain of unknown function (DUF4755)